MTPRFFAGSVSGVPSFSFGVAVDVVRGFAYAVRANGTEAGLVTRFNLRTGRVDDLPIGASYGIAYRQSDGALFRHNRSGGDGVMRKYYPHLWNPGDALPAAASGDYTDGNAEGSVYAPELDAVLVAVPGSIKQFDATTLTGSTYISTSPLYGVHGLRWADGKIWWIEGDQSTGSRWAVGSTEYNTAPMGMGSDNVPLADIGRCVLCGSGWSGNRGIAVANAATGAILHSWLGWGDNYTGCHRIGNTAKVVVTDAAASEARVVNAADGTYTAKPLAFPSISTFYLNGQSLCLPFSGASWSDENCGITAF
jgi:hypothetical protein